MVPQNTAPIQLPASESVADPAWFYSSLAQVTAAIVGLIGAIVAARIAAQVSEATTKRSALDRRIERLSRNWSKRGSEFEVAKLECADFLAGRESTFSNVLSAGEVQDLQNALEQFGRLYSVHFIGFPPPADLLTIVDRFGRIFANVQGRFSLLESVLKDAADLEFLAWDALRLTTWVASAIRFAVVLMVLLGFLVGVGIVWPLAALPGLQTTVFAKPLMLGGVVTGLALLVGYFGYLLRELGQLAVLNGEILTTDELLSRSAQEPANQALQPTGARNIGTRG